MSTWKLLLIVAAVVLVLDLVWLGLLMKGFYAAEVGALARRRGTSLAPRWTEALLVYMLIPLGVVLFVRPAMGSAASPAAAFAWGALFGLVLYGVYDLTNRAILDHWPLRLALVDIAWGCFLNGSAALAMRLAERAWGK